MLKEVNKALREGGRMLVVDFPKDSLAERTWREKYYTPVEVSRMLRRAGFRATAARRIAQ